ncbi:MAG: hypothetical protein ACFBZ9_13585 [Sphingomonadales bacterium]
MRTTVIIGALATALVLSGCSGYRGTWPELGPTLADAGMVRSDTELTAISDMPSITPNAETAGTLQAVDSRLAQLTVDYAELEGRLTRQMRSVTAALGKVGERSGSGWSLAQLELSRLSQVEGEVRSVRGDVANIAADLASFSARGLKVDQPVARTGSLINQIDTLLATAAASRTDARERLAS